MVTHERLVKLRRLWPIVLAAVAVGVLIAWTAQ
jgi:hypothetical protein